MSTYTQTQRPIEITTPLGKDVLLLTGFRSQEAISQLFYLQVDLLADLNTEIQFDRIVGQTVTVEMRLANEEKRYFNGLVKRFSQCARDETFTAPNWFPDSGCCGKNSAAGFFSMSPCQRFCGRCFGD